MVRWFWDDFWSKQGTKKTPSQGALLECLKNGGLLDTPWRLCQPVHLTHSILNCCHILGWEVTHVVADPCLVYRPNLKAKCHRCWPSRRHAHRNWIVGLCGGRKWHNTDCLEFLIEWSNRQNHAWSRIPLLFTAYCWFEIHSVYLSTLIIHDACINNFEAHPQSLHPIEIHRQDTLYFLSLTWMQPRYFLVPSLAQQAPVAWNAPLSYCAPLEEWPHWSSGEWVQI